MAQKGKIKVNSVPETGSKFSVGQIKVFSADVKKEFNKITWPDKKHTIGAGGVVVVLVMLISFYLASVDLILGKIIAAVLK